MKNQYDEQLKSFATDRQKEYIDAVNELGSHRKAAKKLGVSPGTIDQAINSVKKKAALSGFSPEHDMTKVVPSPFVVKGISTYYNKDGKAQRKASPLVCDLLTAAKPHGRRAD